MIILIDKEALFRGGNRFCFLHPEDENKLLKIPTPEKQPEIRRQNAPVYKKIRPLRSFDLNYKELKAFKKLAKKGAFVWRHFPKCFGMIQTDLGNALSVEFIKAEDGSHLPTLMAYVKKYGFSPAIEKAMDDFFSFLIEHKIIIRDLHGKNLLVKKDEDILRLYMIDGIGNSDFIPIAHISKNWAKLKIKRNIEKFKTKFKNQI